MIMRLLTASSIALAVPLVGGAAAASSAPPWSDIGKAMLPSYGSAELYVQRSDPMRPDPGNSGQLHAVLDEAWVDPNASGSYRDIYFRVLADCRDGMVAIQPSWPDGPDSNSVPRRALRRPAPGSTDARLLDAYCR